MGDPLRFARAVLLGLALAAWAVPATAENDRHAGYYYPKPKTIEEWTSRAVTLPDSQPCEHAWALKVTGRKLRDFDP